MKDPVEIKTAAGGASAIISGVITWILVTYVPAFHDGLPSTLATFLPWAVSAILGAAASYLAPHTARPADVPPATPQMLDKALVALGSKQEGS